MYITRSVNKGLNWFLTRRPRAKIKALELWLRVINAFLFLITVMTHSDFTMRALTSLSRCVNKGKRARDQWAACTHRCVCAPLPWCEQSHLCALSLSPDYIRGGCQGLCQGAEEQVQDQALLCQTPTHGLPACPDHSGGRQHGNVSLSHTNTQDQTGFITHWETLPLMWPEIEDTLTHS